MPLLAACPVLNPQRVLRFLPCRLAVGLALDALQYLLHVAYLAFNVVSRLPCWHLWLLWLHLWPPLFHGRPLQSEAACLCLVRFPFKPRACASNDAGDAGLDKGTLRPGPTKVGPAGMRGFLCACPHGTGIWLVSDSCLHVIVVPACRAVRLDCMSGLKARRPDGSKRVL